MKALLSFKVKLYGMKFDNTSLHFLYYELNILNWEIGLLTQHQH